MLLKQLIKLFFLLWLVTDNSRTSASEAVNYVDTSLKIHDMYLENGRIDDAAYVMIQDNDGFIWIGSDNGLKRYDGYQLKHFYPDPDDPKSLGSSLAANLFLDSQGTMWVAGRKLSRYNRLTETFDVYDISGSQTIWTIAEDPDGLIWIGGEGFGLKALDPLSGKIIYQLYGEKEEDNISQVRRLLLDGDTDYLWVASGDGLFKFNRITQQFKKYVLPGDVTAGAYSILDLLLDTKNMVWLATREGLMKLDPQTGKVRYYRQGDVSKGELSSNTIWSVYEDSQGQIWIGTDKSGLHKYNPKGDNFFHYPASTVDKRVFPASSIYDIFEDTHGSLWLSFNHFGIRRIAPHLEKFNIIQHKEGNDNSLSFDNVLDLHEHKNGDIYIATDGGGLDRFDPKANKFEHFVHNPNDLTSLSSNSVIAIAEDKQSRLWFGTWNGGLNLFDITKQTFTHIKRDATKPRGETLDGNNIFRIVVMEDGRLLLSVWLSGMQIYDPSDQTFESYFPKSFGLEMGTINSSIGDFEPDGRGGYWIAGNGGLELFNPKTKTIKAVLMDKLDVVYNILRVDDGSLWLATSQGLFNYLPDTDKLIPYGHSNTTKEDLIVSIEQDSEGNLWLGARSGLIRFNPIDKSFETFDQGDGLASIQFNRFSHLRTKNNEMYFGGANGITHFKPTHLPRNEHEPNIVFTELEIFQKKVIPSSHSVIKQSVNQTRDIALKYEQRDITFEFSALNFISPANNRYRYKLSGLDSDWIEVDSSRRRVRYTNLDPGEYLFQVLGSNNDNVWNTQGSKIKLTVLKPWWMTWWARGVFASVFVLSILGLLRWQSRHNKKKQAWLTKLIENKTSELSAANRSVVKLNVELEERVTQRTKELSFEVQERKHAEEKLFHMAFHDALTGLPNRSWLIPHLEKLIRLCKENNDKIFSLMFLDGDNFKKINDTHGHFLGDQVLIKAAKRLVNRLPENCRAVRLGGDEFTVIVEGYISERECYKFARSIIELFEAPIVIEKTKVSFRMSIGMVICDDLYTKPEQVLRDADIAMYQAKEQGRGICQLFDKKMRDKVIESIELENDLARAIEKEQLHLVYQPIVNFSNMSLSGFEALIRWEHPEKGFVSPDKFIPIAEENGLILDIGHWVLEEGCRQLKKWQDLNVKGYSIALSINLSTRQLCQVDLVAQIESVLVKTGADCDLLKLEITESSLMDNSEDAAQKITKLKTLGIKFAIDDFGTGYSSLSYLDQLPVQYVKVDKMFVDAMDVTKDSSTEIVRAIVSLAHSLNMEVVAEGIETEEQKKLLIDIGCEFGQGYLFAKPLSAESASRFILDEWRKQKD